MTSPRVESANLTAVRFKLGVDQPAPQPDPLGRARIGYAAGMSAAALWDRGRGVWKAKLTSVAESDLVIIAHAGTVVLVGTVDGVTFVGDRIAVTGAPDPDHPLIGQPDPLDNTSRNPVAYGEVATVRPVPGQRPYAAVLADAIAVFTEAARLRLPTLRQDEGGNWVRDYQRTTSANWPEFVTLTLAGTAANVGGVSNALQGRPGSWEAAGVEALLDSTVGPDGDDLWRHRRDPIRIDITVYAVLLTLASDGDWLLDAEDDLDQQADAELDAAGTITDDMLWWYAFPTTGDPQPQQAGAPAWSWESFQSKLTDAGLSPTDIARHEQQLRSPGAIRSGMNRVGVDRDEAKDAIAAIEARHEEISAKYAKLRDELKNRRLQLWADYAVQLRANLYEEISSLEGLNVAVEITIDAVTEDDTRLPAPYSLEWDLLERAAATITADTIVPAAVRFTPDTTEDPTKGKEKG